MFNEEGVDALWTRCLVLFLFLILTAVTPLTTLFSFTHSPLSYFLWTTYMPANQHHTEYAPPVLRAPSPASSIGIVYGEDRTSYSDCEEQISQSSFESKWEERLALHLPRPEELLADQDPLLPRHPPNSVEEKRTS